MAANNIEINFDASSGIEASNKLRDALKGLSASLGDFTVKTVDFNAKGKATQVVIQQTNEEGQKLTRTFKLQGDQLEQLNAKLQESAKNQEALIKQQQLATASAQAQSIIAAKAPLDTPTEAVPTAMLERLQRAQQALVKTIAFGGLPREEIDRVITDLSNGIVRLETGPAAALQRAFIRVLDTTRQINETVGKTAATAAKMSSEQARTFGAAAQAAFPVPPAATAQQLLNYQQALIRVQQTAQQSGLPLQSLNEILTNLQKGPQAAIASMSKLPVAAQQVQAALVQLGTAAGGLGPPFNNANQALGAFGRNFQRLITSLPYAVGLQLVHRLLGAVVTQMQQAVSESAKLQVAISELRTISQDSGVTFQQFEGGIRRVADAFGLSQIDVAEANYQALSSQVIKATESEAFLTVAAQLARAGRATLTEATNSLTTATRAWGLSNQEAIRTAATLFRTVELGRVRVADLNNVLSQTGPAAKALGISLQETLALLATLTSRGVSPAQAGTQISALFNALIKPSQEMKRALNEIGASAESLIAEKGLIGFIDILGKKAEEGSRGLGELTPNIRAMRAALGTAGEGAAAFQENLAKMTDAIGPFQEAIKIMGESAGKQLLERWQRIKNFFVSDFGANVVSGLNNFLGMIEKINVSMSTLVSVFLTAGTALAVFLAALKIGTAIAASYTAAAGTAAAGTSAMGVAMSAFAISGPAAIALVVAALVGGLVLGIRQSKQELDDLAKISEKTRAKMEADFARINEARKAADAEQIADFKRTQEVGYKAALAASNAQVALFTKQKDLIITQNRAVQEQLKVALANAVSAQREVINKLRSDATKAETQIKKSQKFLEDIKAKSEERVFERIIKFETDPTRQLQSIANRIRQLQREAQALFEKGDEASVSGARKRFEEIDRLTERSIDIRGNLERRAAAASPFAAGATLGLDPRTGQLTQQVSLVGVVNAARQQEIRNQQFRNQLEEQYQAKQKKTAENNRATARSESDRLRAFEEKARDLEKFTIFSDKEGTKLRPEFLGPGGLEKAKQQLNTMIEEFKRLGGAAVTKDPRLQEAFTNKILIIEQQFQNQKAKIEAEGNAKSIKDTQEYWAEKVRITTEGARQAQQELQGIQTTVVSDFLEKALKKTETGISAFSPTSLAAKLQMKPLVESIKTDLAAIDDPSLSKEAFDKLQQRILEGLSKVNALIKQYRGPKPSAKEERIFGSDEQLNEEVQRVAQVIFRIQELRARAKQRQEEANETIKAQTKSAAEAEEKAKGFAKAVENAGTEGEKAGTKTKEAMDKVPPSVDAIIGKLDALKTKYKEIQTMTISINVQYNTVGTPPPLPVPVPLPEKEAAGGSIFWKGSGTDTIPAMLSPGEFVVNARNTRRFYSQLLSINAGMQPRYFATGGPVTVGDINIAVEKGAPESTVREIGRQLQREIRRGTISLR